VSRLLLNCDIGESFGNWTMGLDAEVMPFIDCANVACGFHAGDPSIMRKTVSLALKHGVQVGAHPAYQDLQGFGRRSMAYTPQEIQDLLHYQIGALDGICRAQGGRVSYVKPHGAMYNDMMANPTQLRAVIQGDEFGVTLWFEAFADRAYDNNGHLVSRQLPGAVHHDADVIVGQALTISRGEPLIASDGSPLVLQANTLCVHGDNASSVAAVQRIREALKSA
jgi:5-oxoprolinase (ATP-hydrolysing) subunit A